MSVDFHQTAFAVSDLHSSVRHWADVLGVGPWSVYTMGPEVLNEMTYGGEPATFGFRHALAWSGQVQFELVEPLEGPSIFADQLASRGPGLNHVGRIARDHRAESTALIAAGYIPVQSARFGKSRDGRFAYFAAPNDGMIVELIQPPSERYAPDYVYPPSEGPR